jgi:hypothetical protein
MQNSRVLLPEIGFMRESEVNKRHTFRDFSAVIYQVSELIAYGAIEVAIKAHWQNEDYLENLPDGLKNRIVFIDVAQNAKKKSEVIFRPIAEELGYEIENMNALMHSEGSIFQHEVGTIFCNIEDFFIGIDEKLLIDVDIVSMRNSVEILRNNVKSPDAIQSLAMLAGLLSSYEYTLIEGISLKSTASEELVQIFNRFVEDEVYKELSHENHNLGIPEKMERSKTMISRLVKDVFKKPFAKEVADISSKGITAASGVPAPTSKTFDSLFSSIYLPPVAPVRSTLISARSKWERDKPEIILPRVLQGDGIKV